MNDKLIPSATSVALEEFPNEPLNADGTFRDPLVTQPEPHGKYGITESLDPVTRDASQRFMVVMQRKLYEAQVKHGYKHDWMTWDLDDMRRALREHVDKGDPRDVANIAMFLWARGEKC